MYRYSLSWRDWCENVSPSLGHDKTQTGNALSGVSCGSVYIEADFVGLHAALNRLFPHHLLSHCENVLEITVMLLLNFGL